ncbi:hypothetical protein PIB30_040487 [Stylosanthes scabra]|uniref:LOB domain-containing protein n=1 Tax=Stylosanthes scabra TaxID=79078 RepID=A0ABU6ZDA5_9FABA|nr:hypothetical protein [Stylosanthes scabra]
MADQVQPPPPPPPPPQPPQRKACWACAKHRKRCQPDCIFARYFLHDPDTLANIYKLFGLENARKLLMKVRPEEQEETARTLGVEANMWKQYPVTGPVGMINDYANLIQQNEIELATIHAFIQQCKMAQCSSSSAEQNDENAENQTLSSSVDAMPIPPNDGKPY